MAPILANADVQERLLPYLPSGESLPQTAEEIQNTLTSPQFQQVMLWPSCLTLARCPSPRVPGLLPGHPRCLWPRPGLAQRRPALLCRPWACSVRPWPQGSWAPSCASLGCLQRPWRPPTRAVSIARLPATVAGLGILWLKAQASLFAQHRAGCPQGPGSWPQALPCLVDVEAFAKAMQSSARSEQKEGNGKDKKDEEEDMSLD